jgi:integrase/recombinase XerD
MLSVYSSHYPPYTSDDINYKRCRCPNPKWMNRILGSDGPFIRRSAKTRSWAKAEGFKRDLEAEYEAKQNGAREVVDVAPEKISVKDAVARFINSKRNENLAESTLDKLKTTFEKQFQSWATESRLKHLEEIATADLEAFRDTWEDGPLAKKKKQERLIGFFYYCVRLVGSK